MSARPDVLIIGGGASGGVAALRLAEAGMSVVCLEQGDWPDREEFPAPRRDYELVARKQWATDPNVRQMPSDYPIDVADSDISPDNFNGVGGGTVLYGALWPRLRPSDFRVRSEDGVGDDWPIAYEELRPYYERVDRQVGISGLQGNPACPDVNPHLPPLPIGKSGLRLAHAHAKLGWHWWPDTNAILSVEYEGRHPCVQRASCLHGCPEAAKSSIDLTHWPKATELGVELITGARVRRVLLDENGLAAGAEWIDREGGEHVLEADIVVMAAGGIGTPRLLMNSATASAPDGLANGSGLLGRRLMMHPTLLTIGFFEENLRSWQGHFGSLIQSYEFYETDRGRGFVRGAKWSLHTTGGALDVALPPGDGAVWGPGHHAAVAAQLGHGAAWIGICEDLPEESNRVVLSKDLVDGDGIPAPELHYAVSANSQAMIDWHGARQGESLEAAGAHTTFSMRIPSTGHTLGTARMGDDPTTSVVDRWGVSHDIPNLVVADASVFVTAGGLNPGSTVCALALRTAEHLIEARKSFPVPSHRSEVEVGIGVAAAADPHPPAAATTPALLPGDEQRERLRGLADALIPDGDGMPAAGAAGVADQLLDQVLAGRPDIVEALDRALAEPFASAEARLAELKDEDPEARAAVELVVAGGYYMNEDVRRQLGYPGQIAIPIRPDPHPAYVEEGLLDHMLAFD